MIGRKIRVGLMLVMSPLGLALSAPQPLNRLTVSNAIRPPVFSTTLVTNRLAIQVAPANSRTVRRLGATKTTAAGSAVVLTSNGQARLELTYNLKTSPLPWRCESNCHVGILYVGAKLTGRHPELQKELQRGIAVRFSGENGIRPEPDVVQITREGTGGEQWISVLCDRGAAPFINVRSDYDSERFAVPLEKLDWRASLCCSLEKVMPCAVWGWAILGGWIGMLGRGLGKKDRRWRVWLVYSVQSPLLAILLVLITHAGLAKPLLGLDIDGRASATVAAALGAFIGFAGVVWLEGRIAKEPERRV